MWREQISAERDLGVFRFAEMTCVVCVEKSALHFRSMSTMREAVGRRGSVLFL